MVKTNIMPAHINTEDQQRASSGAEGLAAPIISAAAAFLITDVRIGGALSPFGVSLAASLSPVNGLAALLGSAAAAAAGGNIWSCITELAATSVMTAYSFIFRRKNAKKLAALVSGIVYFLCACAVTAGGKADWVMFLAVLFRSVMCWAMTKCFGETLDILKNGIYAAKKPARSGGIFFRDSESFRIAAPAAVYMLMIAALCSKEAGILNLGRIAAGFSCAAAARKFGVRGGAAVGILSSAAFLLCEPSLGRCGAMLAFSAMLSGAYMPRGKYAVNIAFICACFGITAAAGMPSGTPEFIADMGAAAVIYCIVPERFYLPKLNGICAEGKESSGYGADRLAFAAEILEDVGNDVENASEMLMRVSENKRTSELCDAVKSSVCGSICPPGRCSAAGGGGNGDILDGCFKAAQIITEKKGSITGKELPAGFEGCKKRAQLAEGYNRAYQMRSIQARRDAYMRRFLENASEQLSASCSMMFSLADEINSEMTVDFALSESAEKLLIREKLDVKSVCVSFDEDMHPFCEAYLYGDKSLSEVTLSDVSEKLGLLLGAELEKPAILKCGNGGRLLCRVRWCGDTVYYPDCRIESSAAESGICGDSHITFEDGRGNFYIILADGMGKGGRAAAESSMAVSLLRRLILSGIGRESAVKTLNVLMNTVASDEVFTTIDMMAVNCYSGKATLIKMGAAPTIVYSRNGETGETESYEECSAPIGIIGKAEVNEISVALDEHSRVVMTTDGIGSECGTYISTLLENEKLTCEQIAEKIMAYSDENDIENEEKYRRRDDKTAAALRLYRSRQ